MLLAPGQAALAWMVGDPRAQFDVGALGAGDGGHGAGIVVGRPTVAGSGRARPRRCRRAPRASISPRCSASIFSARAWNRCSAWPTPRPRRSAFAQGAVDAVLLRGHGVPEQFAALAAAGAQPLFTLGAFDDAGQAVRDPAYPDGAAFRANSMRRADRHPAGRGAAAAPGAPPRRPRNWNSAWSCRSSRLPRWCRCGGAPARDAVASLGVQATAATVDVRPLGGPAATANTAAIAAHAPALLELRRWLAGRFNWRPA